MAKKPKPATYTMITMPSGTVYTVRESLKDVLQEIVDEPYAKLTAHDGVSIYLYGPIESVRTFVHNPE